MYGSWDIELDRLNFLSFWTIFQMKKTPGDIITLHMCTIYDTSMMYGSYYGYEAWQTELFVILGHFLHFYFTKALKNQNFKQMKQMHEAIIILCKCTKHHDHMPYCSWDMVHDGCHFHFGLFFALLPPTDPKIKIFFKKNKNCLKMSFYIFVQFLRNGAQQLDKQTDRWTDGKSDI